jgi:hypothetical protein
MRLLWTKNELPLSVAIRKVMNNESSHFAIEFDKHIVFHSNYKGAHPEWSASFFKANELVWVLDLPTTLEIEEQVYQLIVDKFDGMPYDFMYLFKLANIAIKHRVFNEKLPDYVENNPLANVCTELAQCLAPIIEVPKHAHLAFPDQLYYWFKEALTQQVKN